MGLWVNINWQYNATYIQYKDCSKAHYLHDFLRQLLRRKDPSLTSTSGRRQKPANKEANGSSKICICFLCLSRLHFYFVGSRGTWTEVKGWGCMESELGEGQCPENSASLRSVSVWPLLGAWNESRNPNGDASEVISKKNYLHVMHAGCLVGKLLRSMKSHEKLARTGVSTLRQLLKQPCCPAALSLEAR